MIQGELNILKDVCNYKIVLCDNCLWITNYIKIIEYSGNVLRVKVRGNVLIVEGIELKIKMMEKNELFLIGKVNSFYLENPYKVGMESGKII